MTAEEMLIKVKDKLVCLTGNFDTEFVHDSRLMDIAIEIEDYLENEDNPDE